MVWAQVTIPALRPPPSLLWLLMLPRLTEWSHGNIGHIVLHIYSLPTACKPSSSGFNTREAWINNPYSFKRASCNSGLCDLSHPPTPHTGIFPHDQHCLVSRCQKQKVQISYFCITTSLSVGLILLNMLQVVGGFMAGHSCTTHGLVQAQSGFHFLGGQKAPILLIFQPGPHDVGSSLPVAPFAASVSCQCTW